MPATDFVRSISIAKKAMTAVMHTRFATQGSEGIRANNHPIATGGIVGVHNGQLWNDDWLFRTMKITEHRIGQVDSEAAFAAIAYGGDITGYINDPLGKDGERKPKFRLAEDLRGILEEIEGSAALAWMDQQDEDNTLHVARLNSSPLVVAQTQGGSFFFASTESALKLMMEFNSLDFVWVEEVKEGTYYKVTDGRIVEVFEFTPVSMYTGNYGYRSYSSRAWSWEEDGFLSQYDKDRKAIATKVANTPKVTREYVPDSDGILRLVIPEDVDMKEMDEEMLDAAFDQDQDFPDLPSSLLHSGFILDNSLQVYFEKYDEREQAIDEYVAYWDLEGDPDNTGGRQAFDRHAYLRPGQWVRTEFNGEKNMCGQVVTLPQTFPHGSYTLMLYVGNKQRPNNSERVFISRRWDEFEKLAADTLRDAEKLEIRKALAEVEGTAPAKLELVSADA